MSEYAQLLRDDAVARGPDVQIVGEIIRRSPSEAQTQALRVLARQSAGQLTVEWNDRTGSPSSVSNLLFVRRSLSAREVWAAFLSVFSSDISRIWGLDANDIALSGETTVGEDLVVLHGERRLLGIPVDGEFVEAFVTTAHSRLGAGVLTRLNVVSDQAPRAMPASARDTWIDSQRAEEIADARWVEVATRNGSIAPRQRTGASLRFECGSECQPYWLVNYRDGAVFQIHAVSGAILAERQERNDLGPLTIQGRPPGSTAGQAIRFRGANVVNTSTGVSLGQTSPIDGTHSFTQSTPVSIGFEGPVGSSNPDRVGRVERQQIVGSMWYAVPFRRSWTPSIESSRNFGSPDAWGQNTDMVGSLPHSTELLYGWLTYWQSLMRNTIGTEITERLAFVMNLSSGVTGVTCGQAISGNFASPAYDPNGSATWGSIDCSGAINDDVNTNFMIDGDSITSTAHEFGHTVNNCTAQSGLGCENANPIFSTPGTRGNLADWRIAVHGSQTEVAANAISNILTRFLYNTPRDGVQYVESWKYVSYDSHVDDFVTASQGAPSQFSCPGTVSCPTSPVPFHCVATDQNFYEAYNAGGLCARSCTSDADCERGLNCMNVALRTGGTASACWYNTRHNRFWDTVGDRLTYMAGWRDALALTLSASGGQANNFSRDLVLGPDSYYTRYQANTALRYEATRAVRSVYDGTGFVAADDFPDFDLHATPVPVHSNSWTILDWGNGSASYPYFQDYSDVDVVLFRGVAGSSYELQSWFMDQVGAPYVAISSLENPATYWDSFGGTLTTPSLPTTGWYAVTLWGAVGPARWQGRIRTVSGSDDFQGSTFAEAMPVADGFPVNAQANWSGDSDMFQIYVRDAGTSLQISTTGVPSGSIYLYTPTGGYYGGYSFSGAAVYNVGSLPSAGHWTWTVVSTAAGSYAYQTTASLSCTGGSGCDKVPAPREVRNWWGDNFAGRLTDTADEHVYTVQLAEAQGVSVSVSDTSAPCSVEILAFAPAEQLRFAGQPVLRWTDGAALSDPAGAAPGAGGYVEAITAGTYEFRIRPTSNSSCGFYRVHFAKSSARRGAIMPAW